MVTCRDVTPKTTLGAPAPWAPAEALRSSARSLAQGVKPWEHKDRQRQPWRATDRRRISAARSGLQHSVTINLALTRQAKILLPLRGSRMAKLQTAGAFGAGGKLKLELKLPLFVTFC
jgi:hypothetical protein